MISWRRERFRQVEASLTQSAVNQRLAAEGLFPEPAGRGDGPDAAYDVFKTWSKSVPRAALGLAGNARTVGAAGVRGAMTPGLLIPEQVGHVFRDEVGHRFRFEVGHVFHNEVGHLR